MATKSRIPVRVTKVSQSSEKAPFMQRDGKPAICTTTSTANDAACLQMQPSSKAKCSSKKPGLMKSAATKPAPASRPASTTSDRKPPLSWKNAEARDRVPTSTGVAKPRALQEVRAKHSSNSHGLVAVSRPSSSKQRVSSLVEQQQAMGIAFEADSRALDSILTGRGVTAPLLDRTASLNVPAGVHHLQTQGPRKGGSMFGTRPSVYAPCESRFNFRDGLIQWKPTSETRQVSESAECPVPVVTPFRESGSRSIYKVPERHSVYVKYVTENELCGANIKQLHRSPSKLTLATPGRVRIGLNKPPTLETPYLEKKVDISNLASSTRPSLPLWCDIYTRKDDDRLTLPNVRGKYEISQESLRRTLNFADSEMEGTAERTESIGTTGQRAQAAPALLDGAFPMTRLSEADEEELLGIEEMERRLQLEIEAMEQAKGENLQRMAAVLRNCTDVATALASPEAGGPEFLLSSTAGADKRLPCVDLEQQQQQLSFGSSPELIAPTARLKLLLNGCRSIKLPAAQPKLFSSIPNDATVAALPSSATTYSVPVASPTTESMTVGLSSSSNGTAADYEPPFSAAALQPLQPVACTPDSSCPATYSPVAVPSAAATADRNSSLIRQMPPADHGARLSVVLPLESTECLRSQSQLIAAIDRLGRGGGSIGSYAGAAIVEQQLQSTAWPPTVVPSHPAAALTATAASGLASGGCRCSVAAVDSRSPGHATTADAVSAGNADNDKVEGLSTWESARRDQSFPSTQCTPIFLLRAGTISVLDCGAYSPLPAEAAAATSSTGVDRGRGFEASGATLCRGRAPADVLVAMPTADDTSSSRVGSPGCENVTGSFRIVKATLSEYRTLEFGRCSSELPAVAVLEPDTGDRFPTASEPSRSPSNGAFSHIGRSVSLTGKLPSVLPDAPVLLAVPPAAGTVGTAATLTANSAAQPTMPLSLDQECRSYLSSSPAASTSAELSRMTAIAAVVPELVFRPSLVDLVSSASERFETALLDEECTLYLCRASSRRMSCASRDNVFTNPVAYSLTNGDSQHFVPIMSSDLEDSPVLPAPSSEGSAFQCYTPY